MASSDAPRCGSPVDLWSMVQVLTELDLLKYLDAFQSAGVINANELANLPQATYESIGIPPDAVARLRAKMGGTAARERSAPPRPRPPVQMGGSDFLAGDALMRLISGAIPTAGRRRRGRVAPERRDHIAQCFVLVDPASLAFRNMTKETEDALEKMLGQLNPDVGDTLHVAIMKPTPPTRGEPYTTQIHDLRALAVGKDIIEPALQVFEQTMRYQLTAAQWCEWVMAATADVISRHHFTTPMARNFVTNIFIVSDGPRDMCTRPSMTPSEADMIKRLCDWLDEINIMRRIVIGFFTPNCADVISVGNTVAHRIARACATRILLTPVGPVEDYSDE